MKKFLKLTIVILIMVKMNAMAEENANASDQFYLYIGAYTQGEEEGIYVYKFDATDGDLKYLSTATGVVNPSYLAIHPKNNLLIAVNETGDYEGEKSGSVSSFEINPENGSLRKLNQVPSGGGAPCYVSINKSATLAFVANYSGGNVSVFPIADHGKLMPYSILKQHSGSGPKESQKGPRAHAIVLDPKEDYILAVDLGIDKVISYAIGKKNDALKAQSELELTKGAGPRHLTFHPNKKLAFVISELNSTITSCTYDTKSGKLTSVMTVNTLPDGFSGESYCADIHVSPNGKFLYGSNRGHDSIVIFKIDQKTGELTYVDHHSVNGKWPRNFMIDPTGQFLLAANQNSNNIVVFKIDSETGKLRANGVEIEVSKPVCLKMMEIK
ncbi:MAG: lactonase family protein [Cyclobacteriaceae bacterium]|nr:lactonase family protein [Cyclobacteriaceae bacterium]